jgi:hypothetical protein
MSDEDMRALERLASADGAPASRLRYAEALVRRGRQAEAVQVLVPARRDPEIRDRIGRFGLETPPEGLRTGFNAVAPLSTPRVRWRTPTSFTLVTSAHACPLALAVSGTDALRLGVALEPGEVRPPGRLWTVLLDPETGARIAELEGVSEALGIAGSVLVGVAENQGSIVGCDLLTGDRLWQFELEGRVALALEPGGLFTFVRRRGPLELRRHTFPDPRVAPDPEGVLVAALPDVDLDTVDFLRVSRHFLVLGARLWGKRLSEFEYLVFDRPTGARVEAPFRGEPSRLQLDDAGVVAYEYETTCYDGRGGRLWAVASERTPRFVLMGPDVIVVGHFEADGTGETIAYERATGRPCVLGVQGDALALARGAIYVHHDSWVSVFRTDGRLLGRVDLSPLRGYGDTLLPQPGRVFVVTGSSDRTSEIVCLDEAPVT